MKQIKKSTLKIFCVFLLSTLILFLGFFTNFWNVANENWFHLQNYDMESFVFGRIVKSNQDGVFSSGGLTGIGSADSIPAEFNESSFDFQRQAYFNGISFGSFSPYYSQIGGQGILFSILDQTIPLTPQIKFRIYQIFTSLLTATTIAMIVLWFYFEFGFLASLFVLVSTVLSPWLVVFGGKLWWSTWSFYLPMVVIMYNLRNRNHTIPHRITFGFLIFIVVFVKCLFTGYEFITTTLIMMMVPFIYYSIKRNSTLNEFISGFLVLIFSSFLAILLSFTILCFQIGSISGNPFNGVEHIIDALTRRTYGGANNFSSPFSGKLESNTSLLLMTYLKGGYFGPNEFHQNLSPFLYFFVTKVSYLFLIILFGIMSFLLIAFRKLFPDQDNQKTILALVLSMWFSLFAPLSWFIIFKEHSVIHFHMNYIVWQMPYTFFGFAVCGFVFQPFFPMKFKISDNVDQKEKQ